MGSGSVGAVSSPVNLLINVLFPDEPIIDPTARRSLSGSYPLAYHAMQIPTRAERRALFADALLQETREAFVGWDADAGNIIRAAVEVVLGDPSRDATRPTTARHRAQFLALADAIEGCD